MQDVLLTFTRCYVVPSSEHDSCSGIVYSMLLGCQSCEADSVWAHIVESDVEVTVRLCCPLDRHNESLSRRSGPDVQGVQVDLLGTRHSRCILCLESEESVLFNIVLSLTRYTW